MFQLCLFKLTAGGVAFTLSDAAAVPDPSVTLNLANHVIFDKPIELLMAYAFGQTDLSEMQFQTPKLRPIALPNIRPIDAAVAPSTRLPMCDYTDNPLKLNPVDENSVQLSGTTGTLNNLYYAGVWFGDGMKSITPGPRYTIKFTASVTCVANSWVNGQITLQQTLPAGIYAVVGMDVWGTNLAFARLVFVDQQWRPGIVAGGTAAFINNPCFRKGRLGDYGQFKSYAQPQLDCFSIGACSAQTGVLDLVRISGLPGIA